MPSTPTTDLHRLCYRSTITASDPCADMEAILAASVWNNARLRITGALGRFGRSYVQVLEGPPASIDALMDKLLSDGRHRDLQILTRSAVTSRMFPGWTMARLDLASYCQTLRDGHYLTDVLHDRFQCGETAVA